MKNSYKMEQRIDVKQLEPDAYDILYAMEKYLSTTDLSIPLRDLIKIRVSQINGCAFCIQKHTEDARKAGETEQRIYSLCAWRESPLFSDKERAVFAFADELTKIADKGVTDRTFNELKNWFSEKQIAQILIAVNQMNFWNRIAIATKMVYKTG